MSWEHISVAPEIFDECITADTHDTRALGEARKLFIKEPALDPELRDQILNAILTTKGIPDTGYMARLILKLYQRSDTTNFHYYMDDGYSLPGTAPAQPSAQGFLESFVGGMKFLRTFEDEASLGTYSKRIPIVSTFSLANTSPFCIDLKSGNKKIYKQPDLGVRASSRLGPICEVTENHGPAANLQRANILPYDFGKYKYDPRKEGFWDLLLFFWTPTTVRKIRAACTRPDSDNIHSSAFTNSIFMSSTCRKAFNAFEFYLLPLLKTYSPTQYDVEFRWVHKPNKTQHNFRIPPYITDDFDVEYHTLNEGDIITFKTNDPVKYPLPDPGLLWVRILLVRITMSIESRIYDQLVFNIDYDDCIISDTESQNGDEDAIVSASIENWTVR